MRGKRCLKGSAGGAVGLIPAHAGKTACMAVPPKRCRAHPRSCGENVPEVPHALEDEGSSPLMRGKRSILFEDVETPGLIPAHAGKTSTPTSKPLALRAHPRSCGENDEKPTLPAPPTGSSPLMRGKQHGDYDARIRSRLIPAHAGKTLWRGLGRLRWGAHPRSCGENRDFEAHFDRGQGSSPLTRGKQQAPPRPSV